MIIQSVSLDDVLANDRIKYNSNNHWPIIDGFRNCPEDYDEVLEKTLTKNWISKFHSEYETITLDKKDLRWMHEAFQIGTVSGYFPKMYEEELEDTCNRYPIESIFLEEGCFVRTDRVSLKEGCHGPGPYFSLKHIIESMVTTRTGHAAFKADSETCTIYLMKWQEMDREKEFRVFVKDGRVTAISQQQLYMSNDWLNKMSEDELQRIGEEIVRFYDQEVKGKLDMDMTMDMVFLQDQSYFIEPNTYGKEYSSGSSLFHWIIDEEIMYGKTDDIYFRYVKD